MKVIHIFTQEKNFDRYYVPRDVSETFFLFTPLKFLSSFHTTMCISHYKWFSIYIVIVCKCTGIV
jgi:hypothetical protein